MAMFVYHSIEVHYHCRFGNNFAQVWVASNRKHAPITHPWLPSLLFSPLKQQVPPSSDLKVEKKGQLHGWFQKKTVTWAVTLLIFIPSLAKLYIIFHQGWIFLKFFGVPFSRSQPHFTGRNSSETQCLAVIFHEKCWDPPISMVDPKIQSFNHPVFSQILFGSSRPPFPGLPVLNFHPSRR